VDDTDIEAIEAVIRRGRADKLCLEGAVIEVDTTDFTKLDIPYLRSRILADTVRRRVVCNESDTGVREVQGE
jgi:hypothetical protein